MNQFRTPSLAGSSGKDIPNLTGWGIAVLSGGQEKKMATYSELLKDPRWQKMRLKKLEASGWKCQRCGDDETMLSVHHKRYVKGRMPWEYPEHELVVLCQPCHEIEHEEKEMRQEMLGALHVDGPASASDFFAVGAGYVSQQTNDEVMHAIARQFCAESPYQFESGRFLGALTHCVGVTRDGFDFMTHQFALLGESEFREEFIGLMSKYGLLSARAGG